jgi:DNA-binding transcriptional ArsR family regulator
MLRCAANYSGLFCRNASTKLEVLKRRSFAMPPKMPKTTALPPNATALKDGPNIVLVAALIGDPARAAMLTALMSGKALTATELSQEAGVSAATASSHLAKLEAGHLVVPEKQGRHRYFRLADPDVAELIEQLMGVAARAGHLRTRTGPRDPALRHARVCYNHLAGNLSVALFDQLIADGTLVADGHALVVSDAGRARLTRFGLRLEDRENPRQPLCRRCLDWSERKSHLGGPLGVALLTRVLERGWAARDNRSRVVTFTPSGERAFKAHFGLVLP